MTLQFTVYGIAQPKGNMRAIALRGMKYPIVTESNRSVRSWSQLIASAAGAAISALPPTERRILVGPVRLAIAFFLPRPKQYARKPAAHLTAPDWDKLARAVGDALAGVAYVDDKQIVEGIVGKYYVETGGVPHARIRVEPCDGLWANAAAPAPQSLFGVA